ncbi:MAG: hypothetical protein RIS52_563 [Pseudomonadota bacterium]|jgi:archaetidylinositol phosphate synthase
MKPVDRIQRNLLAVGERRLLTWLAERMPLWVTPDKLTTLGFSASVVIASGYVLSRWHVAWLWMSILFFFINWFGDSLDGSLARYRKIERPKFGYFIDHSSDALGNLIMMLGVGMSDYVRFDVAMFGVAAYLLLSIHTFIAARVVDEFRLSYMAGGPTELRIVFIIMTLCMMTFGPGRVGTTGLSPFDMFIGGLGAILILLFIVQTLTTARQMLARGE